MPTIPSSPARPPLPRITAAAFHRKFGEVQHRAQHEPVAITRHGRREFVLMSANHYDGLLAAAQRARDPRPVVAEVSRGAELTPVARGSTTS